MIIVANRHVKMYALGKLYINAPLSILEKTIIGTLWYMYRENRFNPHHSKILFLILNLIETSTMIIQKAIENKL